MAKQKPKSAEESFADRLNAVSAELFALERELRAAGDKNLAANAKQARRELLMAGITGSQGDHNDVGS